MAGLGVSAAVAAEVLLLTLDLLQQLQRRRKACAAAVASSSSSSSSSGSDSSQGVAGAAATALAHTAHDVLSCILLGVVTTVQAALLQADAELREASGTLPALLEASGTLPTGWATVAYEHMSGGPAADVLGALWQEQAVTVCTALEDYVRGCRKPRLVDVVRMCQVERHSHAWGGSSEQRRALFRLLLSVLKRSGDGATDSSDRVPIVVAQVACALLQRASAASVVDVEGRSNGQIGSGGLGLLLFGRCCLQWATPL
jgi:hypothetical protein